MRDEVDLRALLTVGNLTFAVESKSPQSISDDKTTNLVERPFETFKKWNINQQTSYIESIFLRCSLQPIYRFKDDEHTVIIDGYNRYKAIVNFCNNQLKLSAGGLKKLKFLAGKRYKNLSPKEKDHFLKSKSIRLFDYSCSSLSGKLTRVEEFEIIRYLHSIYNRGLALKVEEIQKAQFYDDEITKMIRGKMQSDEEYLEMLKALRQLNPNSKVKDENILLNCRLLIASTYSSVLKFANARTLQNRMEMCYSNNVLQLDAEKLFDEFNLNINFIYNRLVKTQVWNKYPILHNKPFVDSIYWLTSIIRKDKLINPLEFDLIPMFEYFGKIEQTENNFGARFSHSPRNILKRYHAVADYFEKNYGHSLNHYFDMDDGDSLEMGTLKDIDELMTKNFSFEEEEILVYDLLKAFRTSKFDVRPYYQRLEVMNIALASKVIESILLGIAIPFLLFYDRNCEDGVITEVVDGQQRILCLIGFLQSYFINSKGIEEKSWKDGFALKDLSVLTELNDSNVSGEDAKKLDVNLYNKIMETKLYITKTSYSEIKGFSAVDHYIRLNKNNFTLKDHSYRMWYLTADYKLIEYERKITEKHANILMRCNPDSNETTFKLAHLFYNKNNKTVTKSDFRGAAVTTWLKNFQEEKIKLLYSEHGEDILKLRQSYFNALDEVEILYRKIEILLKKNDKSLQDFLVLTNSFSTSKVNYLYLYNFLSDLSESDVSNEASRIYSIVNCFFKKLRKDRPKSDALASLIDYTIQEIAIYKKN